MEILLFAAVSPPEKSDSPEIIGASPNHGPMSGGTTMTITGRKLEKYNGVFFIYIGNMKLPITNWERYFLDFKCGRTHLCM